MHGSVHSQERRLSRPQNRRRTLSLRLASVLSRSTSAGKSSGAMGTLKLAMAVRWRSTASRKKVQVRNSATSASRCLSSALHWASLRSHG